MSMSCGMYLLFCKTLSFLHKYILYALNMYTTHMGYPYAVWAVFLRVNSAILHVSQRQMSITSDSVIGISKYLNGNFVLHMDWKR